MIHVRFRGRSYDLHETQINCSTHCHDHVILDNLAQFLDTSLNELKGYVVDRRPGGDIVVHPEAVYG